MRTWMWAVAMLTAVVLGVAVSVIMADKRDPTRRADTPDDHAWHCVTANLDLGVCTRSASHCEQIRSRSPWDVGVCRPVAVAHCLTNDPPAKAEVRRLCFTTAGGCEIVREGIRVSHDREGINACRPVDAAAHDRQLLYAQIAVVPCSLVLVGLAVGAVWLGLRRRRAG